MSGNNGHDKALDGELKDLTKGKPEEKPTDVINTVTMMEVRVHQQRDGRERVELVAQEFMMIDHKTYMIHLLTDCINMVARAQKRKREVKLVTPAMLNSIKNRISGAFGGKK